MPCPSPLLGLQGLTLMRVRTLALVVSTSIFDKLSIRKDKVTLIVNVH
jgi:hypothetical protein